ncbi:hypothetical protein HMPREF9075_02599, partial [Capnocytophaga sp. oral taxon 332 str. F0381]
ASVVGVSRYELQARTSMEEKNYAICIVFSRKSCIFAEVFFK